MHGGYRVKMAAKMKKTLLPLFFICVLAGAVSAIPPLQLYVDGSVYVGPDSDPYLSESWYTVDNPFTLWVIGGLEGNADNITFVRLLFAINGSYSGTLTITPLSVDDTNGNLIGVEGTPTTFTFPGDFAYGIPPYGDGTLPTHGIYPTYYATYDFSYDPRLALFDDLYTVEDKVDNGTGLGQQYAYKVEISGDMAVNYVHMDAANHLFRTNDKDDAVMAPFSHDATYVPEFSQIGLGLAVAGAGLIALRKRRS